jgi:hypothetical protein
VELRREHHSSESAISMIYIFDESVDMIDAMMVSRVQGLMAKTGR